MKEEERRKKKEGRRKKEEGRKREELVLFPGSAWEYIPGGSASNAPMSHSHSPNVLHQIYQKSLLFADRIFDDPAYISLATTCSIS
jgi:hypothetical protein